MNGENDDPRATGKNVLQRLPPKHGVAIHRSRFQAHAHGDISTMPQKVHAFEVGGGTFPI